MNAAGTFDFAHGAIGFSELEGFFTAPGLI